MMRLEIRTLPAGYGEKELMSLLKNCTGLKISIQARRAFIDIEDASEGLKTMAELKKNNIRSIIRPVGTEPNRAAGNRNGSAGRTRGLQGQTKLSPYYFAKRSSYGNAQYVHHSKLDEGLFDVAFEICWKTRTPTAANPCIDGSNPTWLTIDNKLVISPFTVKSAIANGFANLLGGCYRVTNTNKAGSAPPQYRVRRSFAGILVGEPDHNENGFVTLKIREVEEFLCSEEAEYDTTKEYTGTTAGHTITQIEEAEEPGAAENISYFGAYSYGKNSKKQPHIKYEWSSGHRSNVTRKNYCHRFYRNKQSELTVIKLSARYFEKGFYNDYQRLHDLKEGSWVYLEKADGKVIGVGKNRMFKSSFLHEDAVPDTHKKCANPDRLCPRCRMFGMAVGDDANIDAVGYKGRFKASGLQTTNTATLESKLLPILGAPKPNKRNAEKGYYGPDGMIRGAKVYPHGELDMNNLDKKCKNENGREDMRASASVCDKNVEFIGTVGAENCTIEEVAALCLLLESEQKGHGFRIGLGKSLGMGCMESAIKRVWIRNKSYQWEENGTEVNSIEFLKRRLDGLEEKLKSMPYPLQTLDKACPIKPYPEKGRNYWSNLKSDMWTKQQ